MSYILDALRRADAERERGAVPGIHAQPVPLRAADAAARPAARPWPWIAGALALALCALLGWQLIGSSTPAAAPRVAAAAPTAVAPPPAAQPVVPLPAPVLAAPPKPAIAARAASQGAAAPASAASAERIYAQNELPEEIRRALPALSVGGSMYSDEPARRMLIVNGQLYHEHDQLAPELTLEQIKLKAAVLKFRTYRYAISF